jgi:hypothetical protein
VAQDCRFHLATLVGKYLVSTVGEYLPDEGGREIHAQSKGIVLTGRGDERRYDFLKRVGFVEVGCDRKYETMVFRAGETCARPGCNCGLPEIDGSEVDFAGYNVAGDAAAGHLRLCRKYAALVSDREELRWLWWATGGVALFAVGAWALPTCATWAAREFASLVACYGAVALMFAVLLGALGFLAACVWRETTLREMP